MQSVSSGAEGFQTPIGYSAGVRKTYAMLEAARQRHAEGVDVGEGVETNVRVETGALLEGLEVIPRRRSHYHGALLTEMDTDPVLARRLQLALVDELAHTNAPESRHPKRYQDVDELLGAGIDVYTTFHVPHLESLNNAVAQITGVIVQDKLPDYVIDAASEIELVDLPPPELLRRIKDGKVFVPEHAARAVQQFFRMDNLSALRELAFRRTADRVDEQMSAYMQTRVIPGPWPAAGPRLSVSVRAHLTSGWSGQAEGLGTSSGQNGPPCTSRRRRTPGGRKRTAALYTRPSASPRSWVAEQSSCQAIR